MVRLFCFLTICLFTGVALLISFKYLFFAFTTWLFVTRGLTFILSWLSTCLSHQALSFIDFDLKWKTQSPPSDEHLEATVGLLIGPVLILLCLREPGGPNKRYGEIVGQRSSQNTQHWLIKVTILHGSNLGDHSRITRITSKITDHRSPFQNNNNEKNVWNIMRINKMWHRDVKWATLLDKLCW